MFESFAKYCIYGSWIQLIKYTYEEEKKRRSNNWIVLAWNWQYINIRQRENEKNIMII